MIRFWLLLVFLLWLAGCLGCNRPDRWSEDLRATGRFRVDRQEIDGVTYYLVMDRFSDEMFLVVRDNHRLAVAPFRPYSANLERQAAQAVEAIAGSD